MLHSLTRPHHLEPPQSPCFARELSGSCQVGCHQTKPRWPKGETDGFTLPEDREEGVSSREPPTVGLGEKQKVLS